MTTPVRLRGGALMTQLMTHCTAGPQVVETNPNITYVREMIHSAIKDFVLFSYVLAI